MDKVMLNYFKALTKDREESANTLEKPSMSGVQRTVVEKYSEQAHFVYELIQNADDARATYARFILTDKELIFAHNGGRHFTVSNPATERQDQDAGRLGDVNSITAIAFSNKNEEATIGKFGVGFKAVFTYTETPHIYGPTLNFKIERFIVPKLLEKDHPERRSDETLFVFPFDKKGMSAATAKREIAERLQSLVYPILFLNHLQRIDFKTPSLEGYYAENVLEEQSCKIGREDVLARLLSLETKNEDGTTHDEMWLMTSTDRKGYECSVGFFVNDKGAITPVELPAFCFFPTKVSTDLNFVVNAPFLLTDSREGIKYGDSHNLAMIERLAWLASGSLELLCIIGDEKGARIVDDHMFDVIPYETEYTYGYGYGFGRHSGSGSTISFKPIRDRLKERVASARVLPGADGYHKASESYVMESLSITKLLDETQLKRLLGTNNAAQVLKSLNYNAMGSQLRAFLSDSGVRFLTDSVFLDNITSKFIASQSLEWLSELHGYIAESKQRTTRARQMILFQDADGKPCQAYDSNGKEQLFLPSKDSEGYRVLSMQALALPGTKKLVDELGLKQPSLKDKIFTRILPQFGEGKNPRNKDAFSAIYRYYVSEGESRAFLRELSQYSFLAYTSDGKERPSCAKATDLYLPTDTLKRYFAPKQNTKFVDTDFYLSVISDREGLLSFFRGLGILESPRVFERDIAPWKAHQLDVQWHYCTPNRPETWTESTLEGLDEAIAYLKKEHDWDYSVQLWNMLTRVIVRECDGRNLNTVLWGMHYYFHYNPGSEPFEPQGVRDLKQVTWICDWEGNPVQPRGLDRSKLSDRYDTATRGGIQLADFIGMKEPVIEDQSEREKLADEFDDCLKEATGLTMQDLHDDPNLLARAMDALRRAGLVNNTRIAADQPSPDEATWPAQENRTSTSASRDHLHNARQSEMAGTQTPKGARPPLSVEGSYSANIPTQEQGLESQDNYHAPSAAGVVKVREHFRSLPGEGGYGEVTEDIARRVSLKREKRHSSSEEDGWEPAEATQKTKRRKGQSKKEPDTNQQQDLDWDDADDDILIPATVNYERHTERARERCAREIDSLEREEILRNAALAADTYSYKWFMALIELEALFDQTGGTRGELTLSFAKVRQEAGTSRTLILEQPGRIIPPSVEDLSNIPLVLVLPERTVRVEIEVASVKSYTLRVKLKDGADIKGVDLAKVEEARIEVRNPTFLLAELRKRFKALSLEDSFNMRDHLPENIRFIFGPPGTGKTTYLAKNVITPLMTGEEDLRVLVLAPTNKAADVLTRKVLECSDEATDCLGWLIRFGITDDSLIESAGIFRDKTFDFSSLKRSVTVTTIARFPYDYFMTTDGHMPIRDMPWDYVIFDEASMISAAQITYSLFKAQPREFIVAGDPHQIAPVVKVDLWANESIYTMVELDSFGKPTTKPHAYEVILLDTQYRSVPAIGQVFSEFSYNGMLKSARDGWDVNRQYLGKELGSQPISIITYPVSTYESVYRPKQINRKSAYQPYSALFTFELVRQLVDRASSTASDKSISIGVVSPYRAQADLLSGLLAQIELPEHVTVQAGTIHGFQGDECDVMIVVLNTPPSISNRKDMFLNRRNILNVSVSRARDSLVLLVPDTNTQGGDRLREIRRLKAICHRTGNAQEFTSRGIEKLLFGSDTYIADNCFSTGHQSVNVYGKPDQRYEIRSESQAVDIQVHDDMLRRRQTHENQDGQRADNNRQQTTTASQRANAQSGNGNSRTAMTSSAGTPPRTTSHPAQQRQVTPDATSSKPSTSRNGSRSTTTDKPTGVTARPWSNEELQSLRAKYNLYMNVQRTLESFFPGRKITEIDAKAIELGLINQRPLRRHATETIQLPPRSSAKPNRAATPAAARYPSSTAAKEQKRKEMRNRPWGDEENRILRTYYPRFGSDMTKWGEKLQYRQKEAIEKQAKRLGLV